MASVGSTAASITGTGKSLPRLVAQVFSDLERAKPLADQALATSFRRATQSGPSSAAVLEGTLGTAIGALKEMNQLVPTTVGSWHNYSHGAHGVAVLDDALALVQRGGVPVRFTEDAHLIQSAAINVARRSDNPTVAHAAQAIAHLDEASARLPQSLSATSAERLFELDRPLKAAQTHLADLGEQGATATVKNWRDLIKNGSAPMGLPDDLPRLQRDLVQVINASGQ